MCIRDSLWKSLLPEYPASSDLQFRLAIADKSGGEEWFLSSYLYFLRVVFLVEWHLPVFIQIGGETHGYLFFIEMCIRDRLSHIVQYLSCGVGR